jgi:desumoylating isopeptidase 1
MARQMSRQLLGKQIDGIWHTGIIVYQKEFYFGGGICTGYPGQTPYGQPIQTIELGETQIPYDLFEQFLQEINP